MTDASASRQHSKAQAQGPQAQAVPPTAAPMAAEDLLGGLDLTFDSPGIDLDSPLQESVMPSLDPFGETAPATLRKQV